MMRARVLLYAFKVLVVGSLLCILLPLYCWLPRLKGVESASYLLKMFVLLGPLPIKLLQILVVHKGAIPTVLEELLEQLFENVPAVGSTEIEQIVKRELGSKEAEIQLEKDAIGVGSIAQVHKGLVRETGEMVAVKVVKPGAARDISSAIVLFRGVVFIVDKVSGSARRLRILERFEEISDRVQRQANMSNELQNLKIFSDFFSGNPHVHLPAYYEEYCSPSVLTMEFRSEKGIDGVSPNIASLVTLRLQDTMYLMMFSFGYFHADPHPGNIRITEGGDLVMLDFGLTGELDSNDKWYLSGFLYACFREEWSAAARRFTEHFVVGARRQNLVSDCEDVCLEIIQKHFLDRRRSWSTLGFFHDLESALSKIGLRIVDKFSTLALATLTGEGVLNRIYPDIDIWDNARKFSESRAPFVADSTREKFTKILRARSPKSFASRNKGRRHLIAPTHFDRFVLPSTFPMVVKEAEGSRLVDMDGNKYIDLSCGYGPHILGYKHDVFYQSLEEAAQIGQVNAIGNEKELEYAEFLTSTLQVADRVIFANSGTEAVIAALRIARGSTGKEKVAKFEGHFHGFSDQGGVSSWFRFSGTREVPEPCTGTLGADKHVVRNTVVLPFGVDAAFEILDDHKGDIACVVCEPWPYASLVSNIDFLRRLRRYCTTNNIVLIFDEVITGFRVGFGGCTDMLSVQPDLVCLGKILGGGIPASAVVGRAELMEVARTTEDPFEDVDTKVFIGGTMSGNALACLFGMNVTRFLHQNSGLYAKLDGLTESLLSGFREASDRLGVPIIAQGAHSICQIVFGAGQHTTHRDYIDKANFNVNLALSYYMRNHGVYLPELHTFLLSIAHTQSDIDHVLSAFSASIEEMEKDGYFEGIL